MKKTDIKFLQALLILLIYIIIQFIYDVYIENNASEVYNNFSFVFKYMKYTIFVIFCTIECYIMYLYKKICDDNVEKVNEKLKDECKIIWEKYHELTKYKKNLAINESLEEFVRNTKEVLSIQIYQYNIFYQGNQVLFKVNHKYSYIEEGNSINAIVQDYYYIKKNMYDRFINGISEISKNNKFNLIFKFIKLNMNYLIKKDIKKIDLNDSTNYNLLYFGLQKIAQNLKNDVFIQNILDEEKEKKLKQIKRGGILRGILAEDYYYFNNLKEAKKNRVYVTKCITLNKTPHIVLFSFHSHLNIPKEEINNIARSYIEKISQFS